MRGRQRAGGASLPNALRALAAISAATGLSGCIAAAAPLMMAATLGSAAFGGFEVYKSVQTSTGGSISIEFPSTDGKATPPPPIPAARRIAVWPSDQTEVHFAQKLEESRRFAVSAPASVRTAMTNLNAPDDLNQMTEHERDDAFAAVCRRMGVDLVFAAQSEGATEHTNAFSFSRASVTNVFNLMAYSCARKQIAWKDQIALVVEVGAGNMPSAEELAGIAGDAWAERVLAAPAG